MMTVGIDIGGKRHAVARCRTGQDQADREVLRVTQDRAGFDRLDAWLKGQPEPVGRITMESSGHYWMCLTSHLKHGPIPVKVVNPLGAKYFAKSRMNRTKSDPADARSLALMAQHDHTEPRDPLDGVELRQASRFAMTLVTEQARVCQRLVRLVELGFPELGELFDDPACRTAREVLRVAPNAAVARRRRVSTLADGSPASVPPPARCSSPRSATSGASTTSTSCWPMPGSIPPSAARAGKGRTPRPPGT